MLLSPVGRRGRGHDRRTDLPSCRTGGRGVAGGRAGTAGILQEIRVPLSLSFSATGVSIMMFAVLDDAVTGAAPAACISYGCDDDQREIGLRRAFAG
jgi:hypothetical protein